jgi:hypothetical protein
MPLGLPDPVLFGSQNANPDTGSNTPVPFLLATGTGVTFPGLPCKRDAYFPSVPEETAK